MARQQSALSSSRTETDLFSFNIGNKILKPPLSMTVVPTCRGKGCLQTEFILFLNTNRYGITYLMLYTLYIAEESIHLIHLSLQAWKRSTS